MGINFPLAVVFAFVLLPIRSISSWPKPVQALIALALAGSGFFFISAFVNDVPISMPSIGNFGVFALVLLALVKVTQDKVTAAHALAIICSATVLYYLVNGGDDARGATFAGLWKYSIGFPAVVLVVYLVTLRGKLVTVVVAMGVLGILSIYFNFRSLGMVCLAAAGLSLLLSRLESKISIPRLLAAVTALGSIAIFLPLLISSGYLGSESQQRTIEQSASGSLLFASRTEPPLSIAAILAKPLLGWGTANAIDADTLGQGQEIASFMGLESTSQYVNYWIRPDGMVSLHSVLLGSWAEGGIVAALLPSTLIGLFIAAAWASRGRYAPLVILVSVQGVWNVLFSPFATNSAVIFAASALLAAWTLQESRIENGSIVFFRDRNYTGTAGTSAARTYGSHKRSSSNRWQRSSNYLQTREAVPGNGY